MKNGDTRSQPWLARAMKEYTRNDEVVQTALMLVDIAPTPSLDEIRTWTDEQCLLAEDWAWNVHASASDNNNRVPAVPEHLARYRNRYPLSLPSSIAALAIEEMSADSGACFHPTAKQRAEFEAGLARMQKAGCSFTEAEISLFAAGEHGEMLAHFQRFDGFAQAQAAMVAILEELNDAGEPKTDDERARDACAAHPSSTTQEKT